MNGCKHTHICRTDHYRPHAYTCYLPECMRLESGVCDQCYYVAAKRAKGMRPSKRPYQDPSNSQGSPGGPVLIVGRGSRG